jgi:hypothetical protein
MNLRLFYVKCSENDFTAKETYFEVFLNNYYNYEMAKQVEIFFNFEFQKYKHIKFKVFNNFLFNISMK